jgi:Ser/Thr protein kinase RdoA (MazF antagonist)
VQSTPTGQAVARFVERHYDLGEVRDCALLRRGFNHVYGLRFADGRRAVARLSAERPRGAPNTDYEAAFLAHVKARGACVAAPVPARDAHPAISMPLPEGERTLMLFDFLQGDPPGESLRDVEATGRGLAMLHEAGRSYAGPPSRYTLDAPRLLRSSLAHLCTAPTLDVALRADFTALAQRLEARLEAMAPLARVTCHGDCHGSNNFMTDGNGGTRVASFFDFDDAGPGCLAYELCVYLWAMLPRKAGGELDAAERERWRRYLAGYRSVRTIAAADFEAIAPFLGVRQFWLLAEYAGRVAVWGSQTLPTPWLRKQVDMLAAWESLETPE